jgi:hypothetical protein
MQQTGARAAVEHRVRAGADEERALERGDRAVHRLGRRKRPVIVARTIARAAVLHDLRRRVVLGDEDVGERLVVPHQDVEAWAQPLDQIGLEQQSLGLGRGGDEFEPGGRRDHPLDAGVVAGRPRISDDALADVLRLADVEHLAGAIEHAIDAGRSWRVPGVGDDGGAACGKPGRRRFLESGRRLVLELRQARILLVVLEVEIGLEILFQRRHGQEVMPAVAQAKRRARIARRAAGSPPGSPGPGEINSDFAMRDMILVLPPFRHAVGGSPPRFSLQP